MGGLIYVSRDRHWIFQPAGRCINIHSRKLDLDSGNVWIELSGNRTSYNNSVMERAGHRGDGHIWLLLLRAAAWQQFFVIRGRNLVYKVETEAAKLKSSGTGLWCRDRCLTRPPQAKESLAGSGSGGKMRTADESSS